MPNRLASHAPNGIANPLNMAAISGARCNRIAIDTHRYVIESRKSHAAYFPHPRRPAEDHLSLFTKKETLSGSTICSRNSPAPSASSHSTNPQSLAASASSSISDSSSQRTLRAHERASLDLQACANGPQGRLPNQSVVCLLLAIPKADFLRKVSFQ